MKEMQRTDFNTIGLFTRDRSATVEFYTKSFGFTTEWDGVEQNVEMILGNMRIILFPLSLFGYKSSCDYVESVNGSFELSFEVPSFADVEKSYQNALKYGGEEALPPATEHDGEYICYVTDPDGNLIEIWSFTK